MIPDVSRALPPLTEPMQFAVIRKDIELHQVAETTLAIEWTEASAQPLKARELDIKSEGQRKWKWLHVFTSEAWKMDWVVQDFEGLQYRVDSIEDWTSGGFQHYIIVEQPNTVR